MKMCGLSSDVHIDAWRLMTIAASVVTFACDFSEPRFEYRTEREWVRSLKTGSAEQRIWAAAALSAMKAKSEDGRAALARAFQDSSDAVSMAAARALGVLGDTRVSRERVLARTLAVATNGEERDRVIALEVLGLESHADPRSIPVLISALGDSSSGIRATAALSLGMLGSMAKPALNALYAALRDTSDFVRHEVQDAITAISGEKLRHK